ASVASATPTYVKPPAPEPPEPMAWRATPLVPPQEVLEELELKARVPATEKGYAQANVFFLNYDGVTLKWGNQDNSATNTTIFQQFARTYQPYGQGAKRAASLQAVKADWAKYDVVITDVRPQSGLYTMCVNSPTNPFGGGVLGVAPLDCGDSMAANIVLAFHSANDQFSAATQATTMSQEIAHAYGLEHVNQPMDIMNPYNAGGDPSFLDQCLQLDGGGNPIQCNAQHQQFCQAGRQNSHQELLWLFGSAAPDTQPPVVNITYPAPGAEFTAPADITITAEASDNEVVAQVDLYINGMNQNQPRYGTQVGWDASFPAGNYCVMAEARDDEPNVAQSPEVCFTVVDMVDPPENTTGGEPSTTSGGDDGGDAGTGGPGSGGSDGESGEAGTGGSDGDSGEPGSGGADETSDGSGGDPMGYGPGGSALPPGFGERDDEDGCGCAQPSRPGASALLLVGLLGLACRRRRG
ncbi:MAG TPA: Ig-like domain-containing protein, partial [Nannocystis sp.]